jgi:hypothetical protein
MCSRFVTEYKCGRVMDHSMISNCSENPNLVNIEDCEHYKAEVIYQYLWNCPDEDHDHDS